MPALLSEERIVVPLMVVVPVPARGEMTMLPVLAPPIVKVWALVVPRVPVAVNETALLFVPEIEAVGVPPATLVKANLALVVALDPKSKYWVAILSKMEPLA